LILALGVARHLMLCRKRDENHLAMGNGVESHLDHDPPRIFRAYVMKGTTGIIAGALLALALGLAVMEAYHRLAAPPPPAPRVKDTLRIGLLEPIMSLNPKGYISTIFRSLVFDKLRFQPFEKNTISKAQNIALEKFIVSDDGRECLISLRKGMLFHDGQQVTSADMAYSLETEQIEKDDPYTSKVAFEILDKYTIRLTSPEKTNWELLLENDLYNARHEKELAEHDQDYIPVGSGPYKFKSYDPEKGVVKLERWEKYWAGPAPYKYLEIVSFRHTDAQTMALLEGRVDYGMYINIEDINLMKVNRDINILKTQGAFMGMLTLNHKSAKLGDWRVRKALSLLIPREAIVASPNGLRGKGIAMDTMLNNIHPYTGPQLVDGFSPERAWRLLQEAGFQRKDGLVSRNGRQLTMTIILLEDNLTDALGAMRMVAQAWNENGILTTIKSMSRIQAGDLLAKKDFDAVFEYKYYRFWLEPIGKFFVKCDEEKRFPLCVRDNELINAYDRFYSAQMRNAPAEEQLVLKKKLQARFRELSVVIPLFHADSYFATRGLDHMPKEFAKDPFILTFLARPALAR